VLHPLRQERTLQGGWHPTHYWNRSLPLLTWIAFCHQSLPRFCSLRQIPGLREQYRPTFSMIIMSCCAQGTAEVVFAKRGDAMTAMSRYNNVQLDGKPMEIELITTSSAPVAAPVPAMPAAVPQFMPQVMPMPMVNPM